MSLINIDFNGNFTEANQSSYLKRFEQTIPNRLLSIKHFPEEAFCEARSSSKCLIDS